jgi:4-hydroxythreonine-4-phosphate dehydrogenase
MTEHIKVGITLGDINGIGPEVVIKALQDTRILTNCVVIIYGSTKVLATHKKQIEGEFAYQTIKTGERPDPKKINVVNCWNEDVPIEFGKKTIHGGQCAFKALEKATDDLASGFIDVLVTAPISKETIQNAGFQFPGHTEYLASIANEKEALMMMVAENLRVALVTTHISLKEVAGQLTKQKIIDKTKAVSDSLKKDFKIIRPKIAILGLNPHAGEQGKLGKEEIDTIIPAIKELQSQGILVYGPYPSDGFFGSSAINQFDAVLAMYHDQGLTPFKALAFDTGVNFTAGLPIVRTSPDHGTAFDIAGQDKANEQSMRNAIYLAVDVYQNRQFFKEINTNPLQSQLSKKERQYEER